jgi:branched-chain amino acid aminotransferase
VTALPSGPLVYHDGRLVLAGEARLPVDSIALRYGVCVFEGIRAYRRTGGGLAAWQLGAHLRRLHGSCRLVGLDLPADPDLSAVIDRVLAANGLVDDCYVRIAASAGDPGGIDGESRTVLTVSATPMGRKRWLASGTGIRLTISAWQRQSPASFPSAAKCIAAYAGPRLALREARRAGWDSCVLLTGDGLVSEAPTATPFLVEGRRLVTPRLVDAVLPGVTRSWVLATAATLGLDAVAEPVPPERLLRADEVFLCGTGLEFGPVREIDGFALAGWPAAPVTTELVDTYFRQVRGEEPATAVDWSDTDPQPVREQAG